ncbi:hypothetical protein R1flu_005087 [Riccia fluitans]|uniref:Uncharacterized protein n=1 Tax=Riccia fluitans TaxID=41844 RepID=A0ABD1YSR9_9MARC
MLVLMKKSTSFCGCNVVGDDFRVEGFMGDLLRTIKFETLRCSVSFHSGGENIIKIFVKFVNGLTDFEARGAGAPRAVSGMKNSQQDSVL